MLLPVIIELLKSLRRAVRRGGRHLFLLVDAFTEAMAEARTAARKYPFAE